MGWRMLGQWRPSVGAVARSGDRAGAARGVARQRASGDLAEEEGDGAGSAAAKHLDVAMNAVAVARAAAAGHF